jgi:hypothetical protein
MTPEEEDSKLEALRAKQLPVGENERERLAARKVTGLIDGPDDPALNALLTQK